jgi:MFS family permease
VRPLVAGAGVVVGGVLPGFLVASLAPRIDDEIAFTSAQLGIAVAAYGIVSMIGSVPAGRLVDRIGAPAGVRLAAAATAVSCLVVAAVVNSATALIACLAVAGIGNAVGGPAVIAMLQRAVERGRHGLAFGVMQAGAPLGSLVAGLALPVVAITVGWRWAFAGTAVLAAVAAWSASRVPDAPGAPEPGPAREGGPAAAAGPAGHVAGVWTIAAAAVLASAAAMGMVSFLVVYAVDRGMSETAAGLTLAGVSAAAAGSRIAVGAISDRRGDDGLGVVAAMIAGGSVGFALIAHGDPLTIVAGAVIVGLVGWAWAGAFTQAAVERAPAAPAWATGVMMTGLFAGAVTGPLAVGMLAEADRFTAAWATCGALALAAGALTWTVSRAGPSTPMR